MSRRAVALLVLSLACLGHCLLYRNSLIDDSYISYRYAQSLVEGHGLVFNAGEYVEGFSNPLWVFVVALVILFGAADPHAAVQLIGIGLSCGVVVLLYLLGERILGKHGRWWAWVPPLLALSRASLGYYACSGMETPLYLLWITLGLYLLWARGLGVAVGVVMGLAALTRPEAPYLFALYVALAWVRARAGGPSFSFPKLARAALAFVALWGGWVLFRLAYFGELLPNTYFAKAPPVGLAWTAGQEYAVDYLQHTYFVPVVALVLVLVRRDRTLVTWAVLWLLSLFPIFWLGGDWMLLYRFFVHALPLECLLVAGGLCCLASFFPGRPLRWVAVGLVAVALGLNAMRSAAAIATVDRSYPEFWARTRQLAEWVGDQDAVELIATVDIGVLGYVSRKDVIDLGGLADRTIGRSPGTHLQKLYDPAYVVGRRPELVVFRTSGRGLVKTAGGVAMAPGAVVGTDRRLHDDAGFQQQYAYVMSAMVGVQDEVGAGGVARQVVRYAYHVYRRRDVAVSEFGASPGGRRPK